MTSRNISLWLCLMLGLRAHESFFLGFHGSELSYRFVVLVLACSNEEFLRIVAKCISLEAYWGSSPMGRVAFRFKILSIMLRVMERISLASDAMTSHFALDSEAKKQLLALGSDCNNWWIALNSDAIAARFARVSETTKQRSSSCVCSLEVFNLIRVGSWFS